MNSEFQRMVQVMIRMIYADECWENWDVKGRIWTPVGEEARARIAWAARAATLRQEQAGDDDWQYDFDTRSWSRISPLSAEERFRAEVEAEAKARIKDRARVMAASELGDWAWAKAEAEVKAEAKARAKARAQRARRARKAMAKAVARAAVIAMAGVEVE